MGGGYNVCACVRACDGGVVQCVRACHGGGVQCVCVCVHACDGGAVQCVCDYPDFTMACPHPNVFSSMFLFSTRIREGIHLDLLFSIFGLIAAAELRALFIWEKKLAKSDYVSLCKCGSLIVYVNNLIW